MASELIRKLFKNKRNNQISITLPKKDKEGNKLDPKSSKRIRIKDWDWWD